MLYMIIYFHGKYHDIPIFHECASISPITGNLVFDYNHKVKRWPMRYIRGLYATMQNPPAAYFNEPHK